MDTMITAEKHNQCPNVINCYRKILGKSITVLCTKYIKYGLKFVFSYYICCAYLF